MKQLKEYRIENKPFMIIATIVFFALGCFVILQRSSSTGKILTDDSFYASDVGDMSDPKALYNSVFASKVLNGTACNTITKAYNEATQVNGRIWLTSRDLGIKSADDFVNYETSSGSLSISPYKDGDYIISPATLNFLNSNTMLNPSNGQRYIEAQIGTSYVIRWDDIECWWCHIGKDDNDSHTVRVGYGGKPSKVVAGIIIGAAKSTTKVSVYRLKDNGEIGEQVSVGSLYFD